MLRNAKTGFLQCVGYQNFIKDHIKLGSLQTLALVQLQNFQKHLPLVSLPSKLKLQGTVRLCMKGQGKYVLVYKKSGEVLS